jgi:hypothetical protein
LPNAAAKASHRLARATVSGRSAAIYFMAVGRAQETFFATAETLIDHFFDEIERALTERGISFEVLADEDGAE